MSWFPSTPRLSRPVSVGGIEIGGTSPIRVQSMLTSDTMDTAACVAESQQLVEAGCEIIRITAPTVKDAANLQNIRDALKASGIGVPLVADIHFKPQAAMEAAQWVEKVRINPGNFADSKKFAVREYSDEEYAAELDRIRERFEPLVRRCLERGISMRIGTNHGSLSDRILNRYGDTPLGMVESALEFAHIARDLNFHNFVFSMKASNPKVMIAAYRLLADRLAELGPDWNYPLHLGVTEAGDGEDGRIKSAIGIGSLLADGLGDTIRVSLTEDSHHEIPVARALVKVADELRLTSPVPDSAKHLPSRYEYSRRASEVLGGIPQIGGSELVRVFTTAEIAAELAPRWSELGDFQPEAIYEESGVREVDPRIDAEVEDLNTSEESLLITVRDGIDLPVISAFRLLAARTDQRHPILLKDTLSPESTSSVLLDNLLASAATLGSLLCDGIGDAILVRREHGPEAAQRLAFNILQAAGVRIFKTDYVACPSCGRTLFNLQDTTARIRSATSHLKGVRIAVMGCIVNGPGEMADADFGYVGGAPGKINLYVGKKAVEFNIPEGEAVQRLIELIRDHGRWVEPAIN